MDTPGGFSSIFTGETNFNTSCLLFCSQSPFCEGSTLKGDNLHEMSKLFNGKIEKKNSKLYLKFLPSMLGINSESSCVMGIIFVLLTQYYSR